MSAAIAIGPGAGRRIWTLTKLYAAVRDLPEVAGLFGLVGATLTVGAVMGYRQYFTLAGDQFPSPELRHDMEKQIHYSEYHQDLKPSILWKVAQWRRDPKDGTIDVGVWPFHNKSWKYDHVPPHAAAAQMPTDRPAEQRGSPYPTEY